MKAKAEKSFVNRFSQIVSESDAFVELEKRISKLENEDPLPECYWCKNTGVREDLHGEPCLNCQKGLVIKYGRPIHNV